MSALGQSGVEIEVPRGWDGGIHLRVAPVAPPPEEVLGGVAPAGGLAPAAVAGVAEAGGPAATTSLVTVHAATFPLPPVRGDYGSGAVEIMGPDDVFVSLLEFGPSSAGSPLFAQVGLVLPLDPEALPESLTVRGRSE